MKKNIKLIFDANPLKFDKYSPGSNLKIVNINKIVKIKPEIIFILAWNFKDEIIDFLKKKLKNKFEIILPFPNKSKIIKF